MTGLTPGDTAPSPTPAPAPAVPAAAASYVLIGSSSIVQVLSPKVIADKVAATIKTIPSGVTATLLVDQSSFDAGNANTFLSDFASSIETIMAGGKAVGGAGSSSLDASGLQQFFVVFEVGYNPPGAPAGTVTADAAVPVSLLSQLETFGGKTQIAQAEALVDAVYANLVSLSQG